MATIVVYDPADPTVAGRVTAYAQSANTPDYDGEANKLVNPSLAGVAGVAQKYWKHDTGAVVEMSAGEKASLDAAFPVASSRVKAYTASGGQVIGSGPDVVALDTIQGTPGGFALSSGRLQVTNAVNAGEWKISACVGALQEGQGSVRNQFEAFLAVNGTEVPGTRAPIWCRPSLGSNAAMLHLATLALNDLLDIRIVRISGSRDIAISADAVSIVMERG